MWEDEENDSKGTSIEPIMILKRPEGLKRGDHPPMKKPEEKCTSRHYKGGRDQYGAGRGNKRVELHQEDPKPTKQERKDQRQQEPRGGVSKQSEQKRTNGYIITFMMKCFYLHLLSTSCIAKTYFCMTRYTTDIRQI